MPAQKPISREYRIYLALWRKAILNPQEVITIRVSSYSMAIAMRQGMYRAIRPFRNGLLNDEELTKAAETYVVYLEKAPTKEEPHNLTFKERKTLAEFESIWDSLGIDEEDLRVGDERSIDAKFKAFMEDIQEPKPVVSTPFYTRED